MKSRLVLFLLTVICSTFLLASCKSDGDCFTSVAYQTENGIEHININDGSKVNGIYYDLVNKELYCREGPDKVIELPVETYGGSEDFANIELEVEAICIMGQEKFDKFLQLFEIIQEP